jgi:predicted NBD/HSP70 family sugar kinase
MLDLTSIRRENLSKVLYHLHFHGPQKRSYLSEILGIRLNSMNSLIVELTGKHLVQPLHPDRPRGAFAIDKSTSWIMSVRTGLDGVTLAIMDFGGQLSEIKHESLTQWTLTSFIDFLKKNLKEYCSLKSVPPWGCGVAMTGVVQNGYLQRSVHFGPWSQLNLQSELEQELHLLTVVDNDTRCAARSQHWFPAHKNAGKSTFILALGSGISSSMIFNGNLHSGGQGAAGEIGHIPIDNKGQVCHCGKTDCLESYCGTDAVLREINQTIKTEPQLTTLAELVSKFPQHPSVGNVIHQLGKNLSKVLVPIVAALDADTLLLMTEHPGYSELVCDALNRHFDNNLVGHMAHQIKWTAAGHLHNNHLLGAGTMIMERVFYVEATRC